MKKSVIALSLILPALMFSANMATAKHRGFVENGQQVDSKVAADAQQHKQKMQHRSHWLEKERSDIEEDYQEALYKIQKSQLPDNLKNMLRGQAEENRNLVIEQAENRASLMRKHEDARKEYRDEFMKDKSNRKALKEVMDIL